MAGLDKAIFYAGAAASYCQITFTRAAEDTTDYTDTEVHLKLFGQLGNATPTVILTVDSGLVRVTNEAASQVIGVTITSAQLTTLLDGQSQRNIGYRWTLAPSGASEIGVRAGQGWEGVFTVKSQATLPIA